jgi:hypothetical protein
VRDLQLGDVIDDYCVKCRRLTNHAIVSLMDGQAAKVRCRTCYGDHDYRHEIAPPTKRELMKQKELFNAVLAGVATPDGPLEPVAVDPIFPVDPLFEDESGDVPPFIANTAVSAMGASSKKSPKKKASAPEA